MVYCFAASVAIGILMLGSKFLGGSAKMKSFISPSLAILWLVYFFMTTLEAHGIIQGF